MLKNLLWYISRTLTLDIHVFQTRLNTKAKLEFISKKYALLVKLKLSAILKLNTKCSVTLFNRDYYFDDNFGIAFLQSVYGDNYFLDNYIKPSSIVVDIGANIGQFNFFSYHYLKAARVFSYEPVEKTYKVLRLNSPKDAYRIGLGLEKELVMKVSSLSLCASVYGNDQNSVEEKVPCLRVDKLQELQDIEVIDLLKIDTEGSEYDVLASAQNILNKCRYILVECSIARKSSGNASAVISLLQQNQPTFSIVEIGRLYRSSNGLDALDILFKNTKV